MWEIRVAGAKGLGVFAKSFIPRGTRIFSERPLLAIRQEEDASDLYAASKLITPEDRQRLMKLSSHITKELSVIRWNQAAWYIIKQTASDIYATLFGKSTASKALSRYTLGEHVKVLSIFRSNAFNLGFRSQFQQAVFPRISRINHSCIPNAQGNFHDVLGRFNIHATRDIPVDEELTLNYLHEHGAARDFRQSRLLSGYGFMCDCPACDLTSSRGTVGEESRLKMHKVLGAYAEMVAQNGGQNLEEEIKTITLFIRLLEEEGIAGRELSTLYLEAARLNESIGNHREALRCAERGLEIDIDCLGIDHPLYQESLKIVEALKIKAQARF